MGDKGRGDVARRGGKDTHVGLTRRERPIEYPLANHGPAPAPRPTRPVAHRTAGADPVDEMPAPRVRAAGQAELISDKAVFAEHWNKDLDRWFEQGVDTPGLVLIKAHADQLHYWDGEDQGEVAP